MRRGRWTRGSCGRDWNCWTACEGLVRSRLELLDRLGLERLAVSSDVFHQEFIPLERVARCVEVARRVLGPGRVQLRWRDFYAQPADLRSATPAERANAYRAAYERHAERLNGRAALEVAPLLPCRPAASFAHECCAKEVLASRHVHIDSYGHVFPGTCAGIILGQVGPASIEELWAELAAEWFRRPVLAALVEGGSYALLTAAVEHGYVARPEGYASKCHLCADIRRHLCAQCEWGETIGPLECYGLPGRPVNRR
jgi:hypothetical protein